MAVSASLFGKYPDGRDITLYTISNGRGMEAAVTDLGAILVRLLVPGSDGKGTDVVLGYDRGEDYLENGCFFVRSSVPAPIGLPARPLNWTAPHIVWI